MTQKVRYQATGGQPIMVVPGQTALAEQALAELKAAGLLGNLMGAHPLLRKYMRPGYLIGGGAVELADGSALEFGHPRSGQWRVVRV